MKFLLIPLLAISLASCGLARRAEFQAAQEKMQADVAACNSFGFKTHVERATCINLAENGVRRFSNSPDLIDLKQAARIALSEKVDKGQMTEADAKLEFAKINSGVVSSDQARSNAIRSVRVCFGVQV